LYLRIYLSNRKIKYLLLSIFVAIPIVTGFAFGGFVLLILGITIVSASYMKKINFNYILKVATIGIFILIIIFQIAKNVQFETAFKGYYYAITNWDSLMSILIINNPDLGYDMGRVGSLIFGFQKMTEDIFAFIIGHGPGSISYSGYTTGFVNPLEKMTGGAAYLLMALMYELGIWGPLLLIMVFILLYKKWNMTKNLSFGLSKYYFDNINVLLAIFFISVTYNALLSHWFMIIFFSVNLSYMNQLYKNQHGVF
jgi:hypothetical protein